MRPLLRCVLTSNHQSFGERDFYYVYRELFQRLDEKEEESELEDEYHRAAPSFGEAKTPYV